MKITILQGVAEKLCFPAGLDNKLETCEHVIMK